VEKVFFGIDIGGKSHNVHFIDEKKRPLCKDLVIDDDIVGYHQVIEAIRRLKEKHPGASFHGGAEATGIYWRNLFFFFQNELPDVPLSLINPLQTKKFKDLELDRVKTDATDARSIARYTATFEPEAAPSVPEYLADLHSFFRRLADHIEPGGTLYFITARRSLFRLFAQIGNAMRQGLWLKAHSRREIEAILSDSGFEEIRIGSHLFKSLVSGGILLEAVARRRTDPVTQAVP